MTKKFLRAGGATYASVGGLSEAKIGEQGGWTSHALRGYIRPRAHHTRARAVRLLAAVRAALRTGGKPRLAATWVPGDGASEGLGTGRSALAVSLG